jgi:hypothetical protein
MADLPKVAFVFSDEGRVEGPIDLRRAAHAHQEASDCQWQTFGMGRHVASTTLVRLSNPEMTSIA